MRARIRKTVNIIQSSIFQADSPKKKMRENENRA